ncbi:GNAT family N-acetyltransferase [Roseomonas xinghualingensis]|uniref:GNAT family N-acetyltransferase n=1 Tax=Roseomonas xinghualingensis TaxID=2986475 RepID=UPI0021F172A3|nr:GNAT family N-acetyltransferase [Roseomonas sp. SXEYE001]MCV4209729.1 N-acetyltransferase [Roseomonas sp. SXEYE001]
MPAEVTDNRERSRFEMAFNDCSLAIIAYRREGKRIVLTHTEVPEALSGQGVGSRLIQGALRIIRAEGLRVVAQCSFVAAYIERHGEERDLLAGPG